MEKELIAKLLTSFKNARTELEVLSVGVHATFRKYSAIPNGITSKTQSIRRKNLALMQARIVTITSWMLVGK